MFIRGCNPGKTVLAECAVEVGHAIRLITKDNGRIVRLTNPDLGRVSLPNPLETLPGGCICQPPAITETR